MTNIVNVVHPEDAEKKWYTFRVPSGITLKKGNYVQVHGTQICRCVTDSAEVDAKILEMIMRGQTLTSEITGIYTLDKTKDIGKAAEERYKLGRLSGYLDGYEKGRAEENKRVVEILHNHYEVRNPEQNAFMDRLVMEVMREQLKEQNNEQE